MFLLFILPLYFEVSCSRFLLSSFSALDFFKKFHLLLDLCFVSLFLLLTLSMSNMFTEYICFSLHYDYKLTNFTVALFSWTTQSYLRYHLSDSSRIRHKDSQLYIYGSLLLLEYSLQLKNLLKNNKNRCHEGKS